MSASSNWTKSLFVGIWSALNFCRKLFFNVIFIVIVIGIIVVFSSDKNPVMVKHGSALYLNLNGNLVIEKEAVDPFEQFMEEAFAEEEENPEVLVRHVVKVIENAKHDQRIKALVMDLQGLQSGGLDKLREIARAIDDFKSSDKPVYAIGDYFTQTQYYLAAHADHVYLNPMGALLIEGYGRYALYFKDMLEKLKVTTHIFRVGTYKSAVEPFLRNDMSNAAKEANEQWLNAYWEQYKTDVAAARNLSKDNFDEKLDVLVQKFEQAGGDFAQYALENGWVDALRTREEIRLELVNLVGTDDNELGINVTPFDAYSRVVNNPMRAQSNMDKVAIVVAKGTILDGEQRAGTIGGDSTARLLRKARLDDSVKAVVLQVDSSGGSSFASEIIRQEVLQLQASGKPVVVSMGTYAASGGYWISANADRIIASPSTITGSIGVFGMLMTYENSLEYLGISSDGVGSTELTGFSSVRPLDPRFGDILQKNVESSYQRFINMVSDARGIPVEKVDRIAQGRVWIGETALELGLVDELGDLQDAVRVAAELASLEKFDTQYVERPLSPQERFWNEFFGKAMVWAAKLQFSNSNSALAGMVRTVVNEFSVVSQLNDPQGVYVLCMQCQVK
ncbi:signal peptide peptidase SppA [Alteromonas sp. ASW11-130]|uniref:signal peptide peptidase SppA n=1 Tax=Alteromonas sp. ASW11-130 TaxID=3015775 RepID=UPI0022423F7F|nr:signal peptide peptidase SppA [Alteromonas sp. ASW11-130]MCW8092061.1 signal peptide peptidase SppA [Alteromonas sp. ASW11-130]